MPKSVMKDWPPKKNNLRRAYNQLQLLDLKPKSIQLSVYHRWKMYITILAILYIENGKDFFKPVLHKKSNFCKIVSNYERKTSITKTV